MLYAYVDQTMLALAARAGETVDLRVPLGGTLTVPLQCCSVDFSQDSCVGYSEICIVDDAYWPCICGYAEPFTFYATSCTTYPAVLCE